MPTCHRARTSKLLPSKRPDRSRPWSPTPWTETIKPCSCWVIWLSLRFSGVSGIRQCMQPVLTLQHRHLTSPRPKSMPTTTPNSEAKDASIAQPRSMHRPTHYSPKRPPGSRSSFTNSKPHYDFLKNLSEHLQLYGPPTLGHPAKTAARATRLLPLNMSAPGRFHRKLGVCVCVCVCLYIYIYTHMYMCVCIYRQLTNYINYTYMYTYIYIYTSTNTIYALGSRATTAPPPPTPPCGTLVGASPATPCLDLLLRGLGGRNFPPPPPHPHGTQPLLRAESGNLRSSFLHQT